MWVWCNNNESFHIFITDRRLFSERAAAVPGDANFPPSGILTLQGLVWEVSCRHCWRLWRREFLRARHWLLEAPRTKLPQSSRFPLNPHSTFHEIQWWVNTLRVRKSMIVIRRNLLQTFNYTRWCRGRSIQAGEFFLKEKVKTEGLLKSLTLVSKDQWGNAWIFLRGREAKRQYIILQIFLRREWWHRRFFPRRKLYLHKPRSRSRHVSRRGKLNCSGADWSLISCLIGEFQKGDGGEKAEPSIICTSGIDDETPTIADEAADIKMVRLWIIFIIFKTLNIYSLQKELIDSTEHPVAEESIDEEKMEEDGDEKDGVEEKDNNKVSMQYFANDTFIWRFLNIISIYLITSHCRMRRSTWLRISFMKNQDPSPISQLSPHSTRKRWEKMPIIRLRME